MQPEKENQPSHQITEHDNLEDRKRTERAEADPTSVKQQAGDAKKKGISPGISRPSKSQEGDEGIDDHLHDQ